MLFLNNTIIMTSPFILQIIVKNWLRNYPSPPTTQSTHPKQSYFLILISSYHPIRSDHLTWHILSPGSILLKKHAEHNFFPHPQSLKFNRFPPHPWHIPPHSWSAKSTFPHILHIHPHNSFPFVEQSWQNLFLQSAQYFCNIPSIVKVCLLHSKQKQKHSNINCWCSTHIVFWQVLHWYDLALSSTL